MQIVEAHAKLTVHLHVTGIRNDGMHLIDAEMVSLDLFDTLQFSDGNGLEIPGVDIALDDSNLITRACKLAGVSAHIRVDKKIPVGGGLGGGSSNAAAVLRWAGFNDLQAASRIGADVPFCVNGGRARVTGIGEGVEPLPYLERTYTLLLPPFGVNTAAVYRKYDEMASELPESARNDLEVPAVAVEPRLALWRQKFARWTAQVPILAGSGSTWFLEGAHERPPRDELGEAQWIIAKTVPAAKYLE